MIANSKSNKTVQTKIVLKLRPLEIIKELELSQVILMLYLNININSNHWILLARPNNKQWTHIIFLNSKPITLLVLFNNKHLIIAFLNSKAPVIAYLSHSSRHLDPVHTVMPIPSASVNLSKAIIVLILMYLA